MPRKPKANWLTIGTRQEIAKADRSETLSLTWGVSSLPRAKLRSLAWIEWKAQQEGCTPDEVLVPDYARPVKDAMAWHAERQAILDWAHSELALETLG